MLKRPESIRNKKTECKSTLTLRLHNRAIMKKQIYQTHPCEINLIWDHNHSLECAKALSFRPINQTTVNQFHSYFDQGHSPSALHLHRLNITMCDELESADRSSNPQYNDVFYLYRKWNHGDRNGEEMLQEMVKIIMRSMRVKVEGQPFEQSISGKSEDKHGNSIHTPLVLAICTPLMVRAHTMLRQAEELVHCDSTASLDRCNCPTFVMSTASSAGGIPLGVVITSGESETTIILT